MLASKAFHALLVALPLLLSAHICEAREMQTYGSVKIRALDKVTARAQTADLPIGEVMSFGALNIRARACRKAPPVEQPESSAFLEIIENPVKSDGAKIVPDPVLAFSGWMFASSPGLSSMDHPIYDIWVLDCVGEQIASPETVQDTTMPTLTKPAPEQAAEIEVQELPAP